MTGLEGSLRAGADVIVNTDADGQYCADDIPALIRPILSGEADIVVGVRPIQTLSHFSRVKKLLQRLGSWAVRVVSGTDIEDAPSGFRALSRRAALQINVFSDYTYTLEMIIQAGMRGIPIVSVPVRSSAVQRPSRLIRSIPSYLRRSLVTILRVFMAYHPLKFFLVLGAIPFSVGFVLGVRWLILFFGGTTRSHVPSLVLAAILLIAGFQLWLMGLVGDVMAVNRKILEETQLRLRRADLDKPATD
jgi:hypothetical protein